MVLGQPCCWDCWERLGPNLEMFLHYQRGTFDGIAILKLHSDLAYLRNTFNSK